MRPALIHSEYEERERGRGGGDMKVGGECEEVLEDLGVGRYSLNTLRS